MKYLALALLLLILSACGPAVYTGAGVVAGVLIADKDKKKTYILVQNIEAPPAPQPDAEPPAQPEPKTLPLPPVGSRVRITLERDKGILEGKILSYSDDFLLLKYEGRALQVYFDEIARIEILSTPKCKRKKHKHNYWCKKKRH